MEHFLIRDIVKGKDKTKEVVGEIVFIMGDRYLVHQKGFNGEDGSGTQDNTENWWFKREQLTHIIDTAKEGRTLPKDVLMLCKGFYEEDLTTFQALQEYYKKYVDSMPLTYSDCLEELMMPCVEEFLNEKNKRKFLALVYYDVCWTHSQTPEDVDSYDYTMVMNTIKWLTFWVDTEGIDLSMYTEFFI